MAIFERTEKIPLEFKVGDKIMGFHVSNGIWALVAGEIVNTIQSANYLRDNTYEVNIIPELRENRIEGTFRIDEKEAVPFDDTIILSIVKHWKNELRLRAEAVEEHNKMLKLLYPENYKSES